MTTHSHLMTRLRMTADKPPLPYTLSWQAQTLYPYNHKAVAFFPALHLSKCMQNAKHNAYLPCIISLPVHYRCIPCWPALDRYGSSYQKMGHILLGLHILVNVRKLKWTQNTPSNSSICEQMLNFFLSSSSFFINV